jgi:ferritin-like metal-binding protein YciE
MTGLIREGNEIIDSSDETTVRDAGLIAAAQKVEHYEISGYGSARTHAEMLGNDNAVRLLEETLFEETEADERLNDIAQNLINDEAARRPHVTQNGRPGHAKTRTAGGGSHRDE